MRPNELIVVHGTDPSGLAYKAAAAARLESLVPADTPVSFKPNLVVSKDASCGAVTHPGIVEGLVRYLREHGVDRFEIIGGSWVGDSTARAFKAAGYEELSRRLGIPLFDLQEDTWKRYDAGGGSSIAVCDRDSAPAAPPRSGRARALASRVEERSACSACYAALIHGLARLEERGLLRRLDARLGALHEKRIAVGRDFRGVTREGIGCGLCASGAKSGAVPGCPPDGAAVTAFLEDLAAGG